MQDKVKQILTTIITQHGKEVVKQKKTRQIFIVGYVFA